jgi:hypothetical protein
MKARGTESESESEAARRCDVCLTGRVVSQKKYRLGRAAVAFGYILLVPSALGILCSALLLFFSASAVGSNISYPQKDAIAQMEAAGVPSRIITAVLADRDAVIQTWMNEDSKTQDRGTTAEREAVQNARTRLRGANVRGTLHSGIEMFLGGGLAIALGAGSVTGGLLGWLLVMKKRVLQCGDCSAVVSGS